MPAFDGVTAILVLPAATAALLSLIPSYRLSATINIVSSLATLVLAVSFFWVKPSTGPYFLVDDLNIVFIVLNTFVAFTTSVFSASYISHELEAGRLTPLHLRFYHAMYQILLFAMNLAHPRWGDRLAASHFLDLEAGLVLVQVLTG